MPLGLETVTPLCDPERAARITGPADLFAQTLIQSDNKQVRWTHWFERNRLTAPPTAAIRFDRSFLALAAAADGLGVALESTRLAEREIAAGRLVAPLAGGRRISATPATISSARPMPAAGRRCGSSPAGSPGNSRSSWTPSSPEPEAGESIHLRVQDSRLSRGPPRANVAATNKTRGNVTARPPIPGSRSPASASVATTGFDPARARIAGRVPCC